MKILKILILLIISSSATGQTDKTFLKNWKSYAVPANKDTLRKYNFDLNDWYVYSGNNEIRVENEYEKDDELPFEIIPTETEQYYLRGKRSVLG